MGSEEIDKINRFCCFKLIDFEEFKALFYCLPLRVRCIAAILYFGSFPLPDVLSMGKDSFCMEDWPAFTHDHFKELIKSIPVHVDRLFSNEKGEKVNRTHVVNCFNRAYKKIFLKITPSQLSYSDPIRYFDI